MESVNPEFALYCSNHVCTRTDTAFPSSDFGKGAASLMSPMRGFNT